MEEVKVVKKRVRDESEEDVGNKVVKERVVDESEEDNDSQEVREDLMEKVVTKRVRDETEEEIDSPEVKRLREDLLESLDDDPDFCASNQDLDSFMKSFEEEITASPSAAAADGGSAETRLDLGYLLEASDDELGIPPPPASPEVKAELVRVESDSSEFGGDFWSVPGSDSFGFGFEEVDNYNGEFVALDGFFDYSELGFGSGDVSWRPETLPAQ